MSQRQFRILAASLLGDSLTLGAHWIYDPAAIATGWQPAGALNSPKPGGYHANEPAGGQTHYGHQALALMDSLTPDWDPVRFMATWQALWDNDAIYRDGATRQTLAAVEAGKPVTAAGSASHDWGGASRMAALACFSLDASDDAACALVREQTRLTHQDPELIEAAAYWLRAVRLVYRGMSVSEALDAARDGTDPILPVAAMLRAAREAAPVGAIAAVAKLGAACSVTGALPATMALALIHPDSLEDALTQNVLAGGDSAARGLALGMLLGATPAGVIPARWLAGWQARARVEAHFANQPVAAHPASVS
jgi:ADP-ribosylglycohydrolase